MCSLVRSLHYISFHDPCTYGFNKQFTVNTVCRHDIIKKSQYFTVLLQNRHLYGLYLAQNWSLHVSYLSCSHTHHHTVFESQVTDHKVENSPLFLYYDPLLWEIYHSHLSKNVGISVKAIISSKLPIIEEDGCYVSAIQRSEPWYMPCFSAIRTHYHFISTQNTFNSQLTLNLVW